MFWVNHRETLESCNFTEYRICGDKMIHQFLIPQFQRHCQLKGIQSAKTRVERIALDQQVSHGKLRFRHGENFQFPGHDVSSKLAQK